MKLVTAVPTYGANLNGSAAEFRVWAPRCEQIRLEIVGQGEYQMSREADGSFALSLPAKASDRYFYRVGEQRVPDPVSRYLPEGVHGPRAGLPRCARDV